MLSPGLRYMALSALSFSVMAALVKLGGREIPTQELIAVRSLLIIVATLPIMLLKGVSVFGTNRKMLLLRGVFGYLAMTGYYWILTKMPIADAIVIQYTNPIFTTLFAWWFLKEQPAERLWLVILICLVGLLLVAKPGFGGDPVVALVGLASAALAGAAYTVVRGLRGREDAYTIIFYFPLVSLPISGVVAAGNWVWTTGATWLVVLGVGVASYLGQIFLTRGLERESAGKAVTVNYLSIVFGALLGWLMFEQPPDVYSIFGIILIMGGVTLLSRRRAG